MRGVLENPDLRAPCRQYQAAERSGMHPSPSETGRRDETLIPQTRHSSAFEWSLGIRLALDRCRSRRAALNAFTLRTWKE